MINVFSRAGFPTEHLRADFISEKVSGLDVSRTVQPRFGAAAVAASADVTALLNDSDFDENKDEEAVSEAPSGISPAVIRDLETDLSPWSEEEDEAWMDDVANELSGEFSPLKATQPAPLKVDSVSATATSWPALEKKNEIGQVKTGDLPQPKKLGQKQRPVVPKAPATPRLMPLPNARESRLLTPQPEKPRAAVAAMPSPLGSVMKKAKLKQTTLSWTPARKRTLDRQPAAAAPAARAETPSAAADTTPTSMASATSMPSATSMSTSTVTSSWNVQSAAPRASPPRLKSILKQVHWPLAADDDDEEKRSSGEEETYSWMLKASKSSSCLGVKDFSFLDIENGKDEGEDGVVPQAHKKAESPCNSGPHGALTVDDDRIEFKEFRADAPPTAAAGSSPYWTNKLQKSNDEEKLKWNFFRKENKMDTDAPREEKYSLDDGPLDLTIRPEVGSEGRRRRHKLFEAEEKKKQHNLSIDFALDELRAPGPRRLERPSRPSFLGSSQPSVPSPPPARPLYPDSSQPTPPPPKRFLSSALQQFYREVQLNCTPKIEVLYTMFVRCCIKNRMRSVKNQMKYFNFRF